MADHVRVRRATVAEDEAVRATRLRALEEAPYAFASTLEQELALGEADWRARLEDRAWFLAWRGDRPVGIVAGFADAARPATCHLVGLWVEPAERGGKAAADLVEAVAAWGRDEAAGAVVLWVADANTRARRFYTRLGFVPTGRRQPLPSDPSVGEQEMHRSLR